MARRRDPQQEYYCRHPVRRLQGRSVMCVDCGHYFGELIQAYADHPELWGDGHELRAELGDAELAGGS